MISAHAAALRNYPPSTFRGVLNFTHTPAINIADAIRRLKHRLTFEDMLCRRRPSRR
jgi:hypothetical protein